ncbi:MAG: hypothetical protein AB7T02_07550 [Mesotoga sp.]
MNQELYYRKVNNGVCPEKHEKHERFVILLVLIALSLFSRVH